MSVFSLEEIEKGVCKLYTDIWASRASENSPNESRRLLVLELRESLRPRWPLSARDIAEGLSH